MEQIQNILTLLELYLESQNKFDWFTAVNAFIGIIAIALSVIALWQQKKMTKNQNGIALLDKRNEICNEYETLYGNFADIFIKIKKDNIQDFESKKDVIKEILNNRYYYSCDTEAIRKIQDNKRNLLYSSEFLFNKSESEPIIELAKHANVIIYITYNLNNIEHNKNFQRDFFDLEEKFSSLIDHFEQIEILIDDIEREKRIETTKKFIFDTFNN